MFSFVCLFEFPMSWPLDLFSTLLHSFPLQFIYSSFKSLVNDSQFWLSPEFQTCMQLLAAQLHAITYRDPKCSSWPRNSVLLVNLQLLFPPKPTQPPHSPLHLHFIWGQMSLLSNTLPGAKDLREIFQILFFSLYLANIVPSTLCPNFLISDLATEVSSNW